MNQIKNVVPNIRNLFFKTNRIFFLENNLGILNHFF